MKNTVALRNSPSSKYRENSKKHTHTLDAARLGSRLGIQVHPAGKHGMYWGRDWPLGYKELQTRGAEDLYVERKYLNYTAGVFC